VLGAVEGRLSFVGGCGRGAERGTSQGFGVFAMPKLVEVRIAAGELSPLWEPGRALEKGAAPAEEARRRADLRGPGGGHSAWSSRSGGRGTEGWRCLVDWITR
jgi:hypothetical protein